MSIRYTVYICDMAMTDFMQGFGDTICKKDKIFTTEAQVHENPNKDTFTDEEIYKMLADSRQEYNNICYIALINYNNKIYVDKSINVISDGKQILWAREKEI